MRHKDDHKARAGAVDFADADVPTTSSTEPDVERRRDTKGGASPSSDEVKARMVAARHSGPSRPLERLAQAEIDLHIRSEASAKLSIREQKRPDKDLLVSQLTRTVNTSFLGRAMAPKLRNDAVALYSALQPRDPIESILDRLLVAASIGAMHCYARAAATNDAKAIDINLRHAEKGTRVVIDVVEALAKRRSPKNSAVGNVNVEAGGQAIVGNVEIQKHRRSRDETRGGSSLDEDEGSEG